MARNILIFFFLFPFFIYAQTEVSTGLQLPVQGTLVRSTIYEGDTIPFVTLPPIVCYADRVFKNQKQREAWNRLKYNVKKVYPYAIIAAARLKEYDQLLSQFSNENEKKRYMKRAEKQLKEEFGAELKQLTMSQGRILIKLIDRETGQTSYDVVKSMRGSFSAFMWQGLALMFNSDLKDEYDAEGEDKAIEHAIKMIEAGEL
ncbi:MAG: DUF4294 domain-containing protein [Bacteroidota bacterium]